MRSHLPLNWKAHHGDNGCQHGKYAHGGIPSWHALIVMRVHGGIPPWHALSFTRVHGGSNRDDVGDRRRSQIAEALSQLGGATETMFDDFDHADPVSLAKRYGIKRDGVQPLR